MKKIVAVASGKGGVGKSTIAANLAVALANFACPGEDKPKKVALVDVDFYGPSIPTLMGGGEIKVNHEEKFIPAQRYGVKYISISFFLKNPDDPIIWRGPMFGKAITQLFQDVDWGDVDICIVDLPPGTGDAQLSLTQLLKLDGVIMVTTPQEVSLSDVRRAVNMFKKVNVEVLGVIENMAGYETSAGEVIDIFGKGGGESLAKQYGLEFLGSLPIDVEICKGGDVGQPIVLKESSKSAEKIKEIANTLDSILAAHSEQSKLQIVN
jgi:ATP-binding protein involved in chromosome partitioning